jgi:biopolymer transport protein ExbD
MFRADAVPRVQGAINVTPLVDVCLVLLIIFMVLTPMLRPDSQVALPHTARPQPVPEAGAQIEVVIESSGRILVDGSPVTHLQERLHPMLQGAPDRRVVIRADRSLRYSVVRAAMEAVSKAGGRGVALITERKNRATPSNGRT